MKKYLFLLWLGLSLQQAWAATTEVTLPLPASVPSFAQNTIGDSNGETFTYYFWRAPIDNVWYQFIHIAPINNSSPFICGLNFNVTQGTQTTSNLYLADGNNNRYCEDLGLARTFFFKAFNEDPEKGSEVKLSESFTLQYREGTTLNIASLAADRAAQTVGPNVDSGNPTNTNPDTQNCPTTGMTTDTGEAVCSLAELNDAMAVAQAACQANPVACGITCFNLNDLEESRLQGRAECSAAPASCGIEVGMSAAEVEAARAQERADCLADPASCGIDIQAQLDTAREAGRTACINDPASCGINTQAQLDAAQAEGRAQCVADPASCGINTQAQLDAAQAEGRAQCVADPASCGINTQAQLDAAQAEGRAQCVADPASCGINTQAQLDAARDEGRNACINAPASCGIDIGLNPQQVAAQVQQAVDACTANPASCNIVTFSETDIENAEKTCIEQNLPILDYNFVLHIPYLQFQYIEHPIGNEVWPIYWLRLAYSADCQAPVAFNLEEFGLYK